MNKETLEELFVPYQQSLDMKSIGFDEPCIAFFNTKFDESLCFVDLFGLFADKTLEDFHINNDESKTAAPTFSQAFKFFRDKYKYCSYVKEATKDKYRFNFDKFDNGGYTSEIYNSYPEAELACLKKLIEITKSGSLKA